ncbi:MAG: amino acid ABC transporter permease [Acetobacteraceae bacterium]
MWNYFTVWVPQYVPFLLQGALVTLYLTLLSMACGVIIGLLVALGRLSGIRWLDLCLRVYMEIWRDVPLIVQLLVIYFALPSIGFSLPAFWAGVLGLSLNLAAYISELFRSSILSVDKGQREAGTSIGMSRATVYRRVILPQAFIVALPTMGSYLISLLKDCSLVSFIAVDELLRHGVVLISETFQTMQIYLTVAAIYFAMSFVASITVRWAELRMTPAYLRPARIREAATAP